MLSFFYTLAGILTASTLVYFAKQTLPLLRARSHSLETLLFPFMFGILGMIVTCSLALLFPFMVIMIVVQLTEERLTEIFLIIMAIAGALGFILGAWFLLTKLDAPEEISRG